MLLVHSFTTGCSGSFPGAKMPSTASSLRGGFCLRAGGGIAHVCWRLGWPAHARQNWTHGAIGALVWGCSPAANNTLSELLAPLPPLQGRASPMARLAAYRVQTAHTTNDGVSCKKLAGVDMIGRCPCLAASYAIFMIFVGTAGQCGPPCVRVLRHCVHMFRRRSWCHLYAWALAGSPSGAGLLACWASFLAFMAFSLVGSQASAALIASINALVCHF